MAVPSFGPFDGAEEDWRSYTERLGQYFIANQITGEERKHAFLLSICGPQTYQLMRNILAPTAKPEDKNFEELVSLVERHKNPKPSVIVRRYNFNSRTRKPEETVVKYVAELRKLAEYCAFGSDVEDILRDRIVCGISDTRLQKRLLMEKDLTYKSALELAQSWEAAKLNAKDIQKQPSGMNLYRIFQDNRSTTCYPSMSGVMPARRQVTLLESVAVEQRFEQRVPFLIDNNVCLKSVTKLIALIRNWSNSWRRRKRNGLTHCLE